MGVPNCVNWCWRRSLRRLCPPYQPSSWSPAPFSLSHYTRRKSQGKARLSSSVYSVHIRLVTEHADPRYMILDRGIGPVLACDFYPRDAMLARYLPSSCVCLSVCMSVTSRCSIKTPRHMWPIEWHHCRWPLVTLKVALAVWKFSVSHNSGNTPRIIYDMFTDESKGARGL